MDTISVREALLVQLVERDDVDATNVVQLMRQAEANVLTYSGGAQVLDTQRTLDEADSIITLLTGNGQYDLFTDKF